MHRIPTLIIACSLLMLWLPACDGADASDDDPTSSAKSASAAASDDQDQPAQAADGDIPAEFAAVLARLVDAMGTATTHQCQCAPETMQYESTQECLDNVTIDDDTLGELESCATAALSSGDAPPAGVGEALACATEATGEVEACMADIENTHDDICSPQAGAALQQCSAMIATAMADCTDEEDPEIAAWMESIDNAMDKCMEPVFN